MMMAGLVTRFGQHNGGFTNSNAWAILFAVAWDILTEAGEPPGQGLAARVGILGHIIIALPALVGVILVLEVSSKDESDFE